jgi:hypothetical protein
MRLLTVLPKATYGAGKAVGGEGFLFGGRCCGRGDALLKSLGIRKAAFTRFFIINQVAFAVNRRAFFIGGARWLWIYRA